MPIDTKNMIIESMFELLEEKSIDKITVKNIVDSCNITRQTFYYHFQDIMDVLEYALRSEMEVFVEKSLQLSSRKETIKLLVETFVEHQDLIHKLLKSNRRNHAERIIMKAVEEYLSELIDKKEILQDLSRNDLTLALDFYTYGLFGVLIQKSHPINVDKMTDQIDRLIGGKMIQLDESF